MARIGILNCSNATQDLGCSSVVCLRDLRKRKGPFADYPQDETLDLVGIISCPGCPTLVGPEKLLQRIRGLSEFGVDAIHFTNCINSLCPFKNMYVKALEEAFPNIRVVVGTHEARKTPQEFREKVGALFSQEKLTMVDIILDKV